ncbi:MAG: redoxin domain-containing protein [Myxococcales bacterium]|nr:redoxin domain-containing protein [Myxococcales bacterium]
MSRDARAPTARRLLAALLVPLLAAPALAGGCRLKPQGPGAPAVQQAEAPLFALEDEQGQTVSLGELLTRGPVVLYFYRGFW